MMKTSADSAGRIVLGTLNNCASGQTPWGTYLSGEENWAFYFDGGKNLDAHQRRWGLREKGQYRWPEFDARFDVTKNPNEPNRFGWVVEVDPMDPTSLPIKRTALGRAAHEGAWVAVTKDKRAVVYSGEDARFEYIYKFVSRDAIKEAGNGLTKAKANLELLDHGTLYVARFDADGTGKWLPLAHGQNGLTAANGFADLGEIVIKARQASDLLGGTKMDRPEWLAIDQSSLEVFCTLTNNSQRGGTDRPAVDAANPLANNVMGNVIRWKENKDFDATTFTWNHLVMAGDPANDRAAAKPRPVKAGAKTDIFACPDGLTLDNRGVLWIQTDAHASQMYKGELKNIGNNQMLACDRNTGEIRRFLTGPTNCEITGCTWSEDGRTMFINVQHPGETASDRSDPDFPDKFSNWPAGTKGARPRSATVVITRNDGGVIGS
jgi:secreted PhoX family phosphatase